MKKLERLDGKLFEELKPTEINNLGALVGGEVIATSDIQDFKVGNTIYTKKYIDKQKGMYVKDVWVDDGCFYGHIYADRFLSDPQNIELISDVADLTITD